MILDQLYLGCLSQASYLIVDERTREAVVVDPRRDVDVYLERAAALGARIRHVLLTHFHADFVSGHLELAAKTGATIALSAEARPEYASRPLADGDVIQLGDVRIQTLATPGHTPESVCYLVFDSTADATRPHAVLTGDTLFIGDVGRPDLMASVGWTAADLAGLLYDSVHGKLLPLPDETLVYPGHGAGSMCGKSLSSDTVSTIGAQRATNYALQSMTREEFVALVTAGQLDPPAFFPVNARLNREERPTLDESLARSNASLELDELLRLAGAGAQVLDVRDAGSFARGHLAGALNVGLEGSFATWAGTVLDLDADVIVVAEPGTEHEAALRLGRVGLDRVVGHLAGGMAALADRPDLVARSERTTPQELARALEGPDAPLVLDVRTIGEWEDAHLDRSLHVPLRRLAERLAEVPRDRRLAVMCRSGYRSSAAASLLAREGFESVTDVAGGIEAWCAAGLPTLAQVG